MLETISNGNPLQFLLICRADAACYSRSEVIRTLDVIGLLCCLALRLGICLFTGKGLGGGGGLKFLLLKSFFFSPPWLVGSALLRHRKRG